MLKRKIIYTLLAGLLVTAQTPISANTEQAQSASKKQITESWNPIMVVISGGILACFALMSSMRYQDFHEKKFSELLDGSTTKNNDGSISVNYIYYKKSNDGSNSPISKAEYLRNTNKVFYVPFCGPLLRNR